MKKAQHIAASLLLCFSNAVSFAQDNDAEGPDNAYSPHKDPENALITTAVPPSGRQAEAAEKLPHYDINFGNLFSDVGRLQPLEPQNDNAFRVTGEMDLRPRFVEFDDATRLLFPDEMFKLRVGNDRVYMSFSADGGPTNVLDAEIQDGADLSIRHLTLNYQTPRFHAQLGLLGTRQEPITQWVNNMSMPLLSHQAYRTEDVEDIYGLDLTYRFDLPKSLYLDIGAMGGRRILPQEDKDRFIMTPHERFSDLIDRGFIDFRDDLALPLANFYVPRAQDYVSDWLRGLEPYDTNAGAAYLNGRIAELTGDVPDQFNASPLVSSLFNSPEGRRLMEYLSPEQQGRFAALQAQAQQNNLHINIPDAAGLQQDIVEAIDDLAMQLSPENQEEFRQQAIEAVNSFNGQDVIDAIGAQRLQLAFNYLAGRTDILNTLNDPVANLAPYALPYTSLREGNGDFGVRARVDGRALAKDPFGREVLVAVKATQGLDYTYGGSLALGQNLKKGGWETSLDYLQLSGGVNNLDDERRLSITARGHWDMAPYITPYAGIGILAAHNYAGVTDAFGAPYYGRATASIGANIRPFRRDFQDASDHWTFNVKASADVGDLFGTIYTAEASAQKCFDLGKAMRGCGFMGAGYGEITDIFGEQDAAFDDVSFWSVSSGFTLRF